MSDEAQKFGLIFEPGGERRLAIAARIGSYAEVMEHCARVFEAAHVLWPEESTKHAEEIEAEQLPDDQDDEPEELPPLKPAAGAPIAKPAPEAVEDEFPRTPPKGIDLVKLGKEIRAQWPPGQPTGSDASKERRARMLDLQQQHKLSVKTIAQLFGLAEATVMNGLVQARKEAAGRA